MVKTVIIMLFLDLLDKCTVIVKRILEKEAKGWYIKYKDKLLTELKGKATTNLVQLSCFVRNFSHLSSGGVTQDMHSSTLKSTGSPRRNGTSS